MTETPDLLGELARLRALVMATIAAALERAEKAEAACAAMTDVFQGMHHTLENVGRDVLLNDYAEAVELYAAEPRPGQALLGELARLRAGSMELSRALDRIDGMLLSEEEQRRDVETVGAPVPPFTVDYDPEGVVRRVKEVIGGLRAAAAEAAKEKP